MYRSPINIWDSKKWQKQAAFIFIPFRKINNKFVMNGKDKEVWDQGNKLRKSNKVCLYSFLGPEFPIPRDKDAF